jgi:hypothetical protein
MVNPLLSKGSTMDSVAEVWRAIPGYENWQASNLGRIRSLDRVVHRKNRWGVEVAFQWKGRVLTPVLHHKGYHVVKLGQGKKLWGWHQLIALAWIGPRPDGAVVNHIDGCKLNNRPENLEYITNSENVHHAYRTGLLSNKGMSNGNRKLTEEMVRKILAYPRTVKAADVAAAVGCKTHNVVNIRAGRSWQHLSA